MTEVELSASDAIAQLTALVLALAHTQAENNPEQAIARIGAAVLVCRKQGVGDYYPLQIFQKVFPGQNLPIVVNEA